jgi:hypothetical protein
VRAREVVPGRFEATETASKYRGLSTPLRSGRDDIGKCG